MAGFPEIGVKTVVSDAKIVVDLQKNVAGFGKLWPVCEILIDLKKNATAP